MKLEDLLEALKEVTYEHYIFRRRADELLSSLEKDPASTLKDFLFFENAVDPHFSREEGRVFPAILNIKPDEEHLITQLKEEHKTIRSLVNNSIRVGSVDSAKESIRTLFIIVGKHAEKETPLYQLVLEEVLKRLGK